MCSGRPDGSSAASCDGLLLTSNLLVVRCVVPDDGGCGEPGLGSVRSVRVVCLRWPVGDLHR
jgi:hypothetical protein